MATVWKKVLMEGSAINVNDIVGVTNLQKGQILRGSAANQVEEVDVTTSNMIFGGSAGDALLCSFGTADAGNGAVLPSLGSEDGTAMTGVVTFAVQDDAIGTAKIVDDAVTLAKTAHGANAGVMIYDTANGVPTFLSASGNENKVLKVNGAGDSLTFEDAASATSVSITDSDSAPDTTRRRIMHGGTTTAGDEATQTVFGDTEFTYKNQETINTNLYKDWNDTYNFNYLNDTFDDGDGAAAVIVGTPTSGIAGTLLGTARGAMQVRVAAVSDSNVSNDAFYDLAMVKDGTGTLSHLGSSSGVGVKFNPFEQTLRVKNLLVDGTQTVISTENLAVQDSTIRLGIGDTPSTSVSSSTADGTGIIVNIGQAGQVAGNEDTPSAQNAEDTLPRIVWTNGTTSTKSVLGWKLAFKGGGADSSLGTSTPYGIGVMHTDNGEVSSVLGSDLNNATLNIGVGAMALVDYDGTPELYIQTAAD